MEEDLIEEDIMEAAYISEILAGLLSEDDLADRGYEIVDTWENAAAGPEAVAPVLRFMEAHADWDLGSPGPLVHFVERFLGRGYEDELVASIERTPTPHTSWMLNRLINGELDPQRKARLLGVMEASASAPNATPAVVDLAREFEAFHAGRN